MVRQHKKKKKKKNSARLGAPAKTFGMGWT